ncbi:MAG: lipocalin family protein, partial [Desulfosalsimonadaceae bacterium]
LPAPSAATTQIEYLFLAVNQANQVVRSQNFTLYQDANKKTPAWQNIPKEGEIRVSIELDKAPTQLMGFSDNVTIDVVESGARFGVVALLYHAVTDSDSKEAAAMSSETGASSTAVTSAASATGATSAGVITAGTVGWSTAAIVGVGIGAAAVAGGTAAAVSGGGGGGGGGGGHDEPQDLTEKTIEGNWNVSGSSTFGWTTSGNITFNENGSYTYVLHDKAPDQPVTDDSGSGTWTLVGTTLTLNFDAGAVYNGTATGDSDAFTMVSDNGWTLNFAR